MVISGCNSPIILKWGIYLSPPSNYKEVLSPELITKYATILQKHKYFLYKKHRLYKNMHITSTQGSSDINITALVYLSDWHKAIYLHLYFQTFIENQI